MSVAKRRGFYRSRWLLSFALGGGLLAWTLTSMVRDIALESPGENPWLLLWQSFGRVSGSAVAVYCCIFLLSHGLKVWRWVLQLRAAGVTRTTDAVHAGLLGLAAVAWLPFRLGELLRPLLIQRSGEISYPAALATTVVERVLDGLIVCALLFLAMRYAPYGNDPLVTSGAYLASLVFCGVTIAIAVFQWRPGWIEFLLRLSVGKCLPRVSNALLDLLREFQKGVGALRGQKILGLYALGCAGYWLLNGWSVAFWLTQFGFDLSLLGGLTVVAVLIVGIMLPSGPGFLGNFQIFLLAGVSMWVPEHLRGEGAAAAMAAAISLNLLQILIQGCVALPSFWWLSGRQLPSIAAGPP